MGEVRNRSVWLAAAALSVLLGAGLAVQQARYQSTASQGLSARLNTLRELAALHAELAGFEQARDDVGRLVAVRPRPIAELLHESIPTVTSPDIREMTRPLIPGWIVQQREITLGDVALSQVVAFVRRAEAATPPWKLARLVANASARTPGTGQVVLLFEMPEKSPSP